MTAPRIPRQRSAVIPLHGRSLWLELPGWARIGLGVLAGVAALLLAGSALGALA